MLKLKNFRGYRDEISVKIDDLTVFVGKNDIGKSTVLEALDIFFNEGKGVVKLDKDDIDKTSLQSGDNTIQITAVFTALPEQLLIDETHTTTFENEYLLNSNGDLEIIKKYPNAGSEKVFIKARHPTNPKCSDLLTQKQAEYRKIIKDNNIECSNQNVNSVMREAIWKKFSDDLQLQEVEIEASKEDAKNIWEKIQKYLPVYTLFQSDRKNSDGDSEIQDPLKLAVKEILSDQEITKKLEEISQKVSQRLQEVSNNTLSKLNEMNSEIASSLNPVIPAFNTLKWADVYKNVSISGDDNIPINKRGSGVKRLILLNFFRAESDRRARENRNRAIIYAIEEPETAQHTEHQKVLIEAFKNLSNSDRTQVLLTTHSSNVVKGLDFSNLRLIYLENGNKNIRLVEPNQLPYPSLNEINYIAFNDATEEYHNELYGYLEAEGMFQSFKQGKPTVKYIQQSKDGCPKEHQKILTEYIRHQIHHPENRLNVRFTFEQLKESVDLMRKFIMNSRE